MDLTPLVWFTVETIQSITLKFDEKMNGNVWAEKYLHF